MNDHDVVIISAVRTPIGKFQGAYKDTPATDLGAAAVRAAVARAGIDGTLVDECIMGNVIGAGLGQAPARQAALRGGLPDSVGALTINKVCGSGLKAVMLAGALIRAGDARVIGASGARVLVTLIHALRARGGGRGMASLCLGGGEAVALAIEVA